MAENETTEAGGKDQPVYKEERQVNPPVYEDSVPLDNEVVPIESDTN